MKPKIAFWHGEFSLFQDFEEARRGGMLSRPDVAVLLVFLHLRPPKMIIHNSKHRGLPVSNHDFDACKSRLPKCHVECPLVRLRPSIAQTNLRFTKEALHMHFVLQGTVEDYEEFSAKLRSRVGAGDARVNKKNGVC
jgi:hypothetical protein